MSGLLPLRNIGEIKEGEVKWKSKVIVLAKGNVRRLRSKRIVQKCLLEDAEGTPVEALMWGPNVARFYDTLEPLRTYIIQGAKVKSIEEHALHWVGDRTLEWLMKGRTIVELITEDNEVLPYPPVCSENLSAVCSFNPYSDPFDVVVVVVHVEGPRRDETGVALLRDLWVADKSLMLTLISVRSDLFEEQIAAISSMQQCMPIIVCRNLTISNSTGFPLTNVSTYISIEPDIAEVRMLRVWVSANMNVIKALKPVLKVKPKDMLLAAREEQMIRIGVHSSGAPRYSIVGKLRIPDTYQLISICECIMCHTTIVAEMKKRVHCRKCGEIDKVVPSCRVVVRIRHEYGSIQATLFAAAAQKLLRHTPEDIHTMTLEEVKELLFRINREFKYKTITGVIRGLVKEKDTQSPMFVLDEWTEVETFNTAPARTGPGLSPGNEVSTSVQSHHTPCIEQPSEEQKLKRTLEEQPRKDTHQIISGQTRVNKSISADAVKRLKIKDAENK